MDLDRIRYFAFFSVQRGCGFALIGIFTFMFSMALSAALVAHTGAILFTLLTMILLRKAWVAPRRPYKQTELWMLLDHKHGMPETRAQQILSGALQEAYQHHADMSALAAFSLWVIFFALTIKDALMG